MCGYLSRLDNVTLIEPAIIPQAKLRVNAKEIGKKVLPWQPKEIPRFISRGALKRNGVRNVYQYAADGDAGFHLHQHRQGTPRTSRANARQICTRVDITQDMAATNSIIQSLSRAWKK